MQAGFIPAVPGFRGGDLPHPRPVDEVGMEAGFIPAVPDVYLQSPPDGACNGGGSAGEACLTRAL